MKGKEQEETQQIRKTVTITCSQKSVDVDFLTVNIFRGGKATFKGETLLLYINVPQLELDCLSALSKGGGNCERADQTINGEN